MMKAVMPEFINAWQNYRCHWRPPHIVPPSYATKYVREDYQKIIVGEFIIQAGKSSPMKVWIRRSDGEGGEFDASGLEAVIRKFYQENF